MTPAAPDGRYRHLDGLRGVAALAVVFCHLAVAFQPALLSGRPGEGALAASTGLARTPLIMFWSPDCAVHVFFVLSGFVLAAAVAGAPADRPVLRLLALVVRRWVRLAGPILGSSLLIWAVVQAGWLRNGPAAALNGSGWLAMHFGWLAWQPNSLPDLVEQSLLGIFATGTHWWNAALWTMPVEFWGSLGVFAAYAALGRKPARVRVAVLLLALAGLCWSSFGAFAAGALLWEGRAVWAASRIAWRRQAAWWGGAAAFAGAVVLGGMPYDLLGTPYWPGFLLASSWLTEPILHAHRLGAALMVLSALAWPPLGWLLARAPVLALGRVSFMVYLCHIIIICAPASWLVLRLTPAWGYDAATAAAAAAALLILFPVAAAMTRLVDTPSIALSRWAGRMVITWRGWPSRVPAIPGQSP